MYHGLLLLHSFVRWIMLALLIFSVIKSYNGWKGNRVFSAGDKKLFLFTLIFTHIQLIIGFVLYMISPIVQSALADMSVAMKDRLLRFYAVEHISVMIIAIILITIGYALSKRALTDHLRFKKIVVFYTISLILILASIPWPFVATGIGRGWL